MALLCNSAAINPNIAQQVASIFLPTPAGASTASVVPVHTPVESALAGTFVNDRDGLPLQLSVEEGKLRAAGRPPLEAIGARRFRSGPVEVHFDGMDRLRVLMPDGEQLSYRRARKFSPSLAQLRSYTGRYESDEARAAYIVALEGAQLKARLEERPHIQLLLRPVYQDSFEADGAIVRFRRDSRGAVRRFGIGIPRVRDLEFARDAK